MLYVYTYVMPCKFAAWLNFVVNLLSLKLRCIYLLDLEKHQCQSQVFMLYSIETCMSMCTWYVTMYMYMHYGMKRCDEEGEVG